MNVLLAIDAPRERERLRDILGAIPHVRVELAARKGLVAEQVAADALDLVILGAARAGGRSSREVLAAVRRRAAPVPVVVVARKNEVEDALWLLANGAQDCILAPELRAESVRTRVLAALERAVVRRSPGPTNARPSRPVDALVGRSAAIERVRRDVVRIARSSSPVLISGETGAGKGLVARVIHATSDRCNEPVVVVRCASLRDDAGVAVLFGHERGSLPGAATRGRGRLEEAGGGTVILDEVSDLPRTLQAGMFAALADGRFRPTGSVRSVPLPARVIATTATNLRQRVRDIQFRAELYYRLSVHTIAVPPLASRLDDIPELGRAMAAELGQPIVFDESARRWLTSRHWPGNVRELRNLVERIVAAGEMHVTSKVLDELGGADAEPEPATVDAFASALLATPPTDESKLALAERAVLTQALRVTDGNMTAAARLLGVERRRVARAMRRSS